MRLKQTTSILFVLILIPFLFNACSSDTTAHKETIQMSETADMLVAEMEEQVMTFETYDDAVSGSSVPRLAKEKVAVSQKENVDFATSKAAITTFDGDKKFIRTSELQFSVTNVVKATQVIEDIVIAKEGFIIKSTLSNSVSHSQETRIARDSILQRSYNTLNGNLTLRVKHELLNQTLREIALVAEQIHYRNIDADDITFRILANSLEQARKKDKTARVKNISGPGRGHKLDDLLSAEERIDLARQQADNALVEEKIMYDKIEYSTITISLWQAPTVVDRVIARPVEIVEYKQNFIENVVDAAVDGWLGLLVVIEFFIYIWPLTLLAIGIVVLIIRARRKKKQNQIN